MGKGAKSQRAFLVFLVAAVVNVVPVAATEPSMPLPPEEIAWSTAGAEIEAKGWVDGQAATTMAKAELFSDPTISRNPFGLLVRFADSASAFDREQALLLVDGFLVGEPLDGTATYLVETLRNLDDSLAVLQATAGVEWVGFDEVMQATVLPSDPDLDQLWGLNGTYGIDAPGAWAQTLGDPSVVVAIIDTGVDLDHPDLLANLWVNLGEIAGNGLDDDGNGYVDDIHGYDFVNDDGDPNDDNNHGTHVAGTIAAVADTVGVVGVAPNTKIMALKFLDDKGSGFVSDAVLALTYAVNNGAQISNNSWGGGDAEAAMSTMLDTAEVANHLFVAAAGNEANDNDANPTYPASYSQANVLTVASNQSDGALSSFSNYGATSVDVVAPGSGILSSVVGGGYATFSGTSMAAPHVAGVAALMSAVDSNITYASIKQFLIDTATVDPRLTTVAVSGGVINAAAAVTAASGAGPSLSVTATETSVTEGATVTFTAVAADQSSVDVSTQVNWSLDGTALGTGDTLVYSADTPGSMRIRAEVATGGFTTLVITTLTVTAIVRTVTVSSPNGGEDFAVGEAVAINWTSVGPVGNVDVSVISQISGSMEYAAAAGLPIIDQQTTTMTINVPYSASITTLEVGLRLDHTYDGDLYITLAHPNGTTVVLANYVGGWGDNFGSGAQSCSGSLAVFSDGGEVAVGSGSAPFVGKFQPAEALSAFAGLDTVGDWVLSVTDSADLDTGSLFCTELDFFGTNTLVASGLDVNVGTVEWTVPEAVNASNLMVSVGNDLASDTSDSVFTIAGGPPVTTTTTTLPPTFDASSGFPSTPQDEYLVLTGYFDDELLGVVQAADYLGQSPSQLQTLSVGVLAFLMALAGSDQPDWSTGPPPDISGNNVVQSHFFSLDGTQGALEAVAAATGLTGAQTQKFATSVVVFLILLAMARSS